MKLFRTTIFTVALLCIANVATAQNSDKKSNERKTVTPEEMAGQRADRLVEELGLDDNAAARFKSIYTRYAKEQQALRPNAPKQDAEKKAPERKAQTDADIDAQNKARFAQQRKELDLQEKYYNEFRSVLSARQTNKVMGPQGPFGGHQFGPQGPQFGRQQFGPRQQFGQQGPQFGQQRPRFGQQGSRFGQNQQFGQQRPQFGQQAPRFGQNQQGPQFRPGPQGFPNRRQAPANEKDSKNDKDNKDKRSDSKKASKKNTINSNV